LGVGEERTTKTVSEGVGQGIDVKKELKEFTKAASNVELSNQARHARRTSEVKEAVPKETEIMMDLNIRILRAMNERITGKKIDIASIDALKGSAAHLRQQQLRVLSLLLKAFR